MKLSGMLEGYQHQESAPEFKKMSFEERFQLLIDHEYDRRKSNTLKRLIRSANFQDSQACIEDIEYHEDRKLEKMRILELSSCNYIRQTNNIIIKGPTGAGKSYIAQAFGISACRQHHTVKYVRLPELLDELMVDQYRNDDSHYAASEELKYSISMTLLQAMWDTDEQITEDELVKLAVQIIWGWVEPDPTD